MSKLILSHWSFFHLEGMRHASDQGKNKFTALMEMSSPENSKWTLLITLVMFGKKLNQFAWLVFNLKSMNVARRQSQKWCCTRLIKGGGTLFVKSNQTRRCTQTAASKLPISTENNAKDHKKRYDDHSTMK